MLSQPGGTEVAITKESFARNNMSQYSKARPLIKHQCLLNAKEALSNKLFVSKPFYSNTNLEILLPKNSPHHMDILNFY